MTMAASLRSSSLVWRKSLKNMDSNLPQKERHDSKSNKDHQTSTAADLECSKLTL